MGDQEEVEGNEPGLPRTRVQEEEFIGDGEVDESTLEIEEQKSFDVREQLTTTWTHCVTSRLTHMASSRLDARTFPPCSQQW